MSVTEADLELPDRDQLLRRPSLDVGVSAVVVHVALDHVHVRRQRLEVLVRLSGAQVARAEDVLDPAGHQQLLELGGQRGGPVRDVEVAQDQDQHLDGGEGRDRRNASLTAWLRENH